MPSDEETESVVEEGVATAEQADEGGVDTDGDGDSEAVRSDSTLDRRAESFLEVEAELDGFPDGTTVRAEAVDVERIDADDVPDDFPIDIETPHALALELTPRGADERTVRTYFEWHDTGSDDRLARLLELHDVDHGEFAALYGREILLRFENGHYVPVTPERQFGDERAIYGIFAGLAPSISIALLSFFGLGAVVSTPAFFLIWTLMTFVVLPLSIYLDAWHLRSTTDWDGGPLFWAFFAVIPAVNIVVVPYYLIKRENARPIA